MPACVGRFALAFVIAFVFSLQSSDADACSPPHPVKPYGIPLNGGIGISTATSLTIVSASQPWDVRLQANGVDVPVDGVSHLGSSFNASYWRVRGTYILEPNTQYILTMAPDPSVEQDAQQDDPYVLTSFSTGAGYDKASGTPPVLREIDLWRVRYPVDEIRAGGCVFSEYHSAAKLDYSPALVPDTPDAAMLYHLSLTPKSGGPSQSIMFTGGDLFVGTAVEGPHPFPQMWPAALDPTTDHCVRITAWGYGDIARGILSSNSLCAQVVDFVAISPWAENGTPDIPSQEFTNDAPRISSDSESSPVPCQSTSGACCSSRHDASVKPCSLLLLLSVAVISANHLIRRRKRPKGCPANG